VFALPVKISPGCKDLPGTNALAYMVPLLAKEKNEKFL
jgi:hypothetical protein